MFVIGLRVFVSIKCCDVKFVFVYFLLYIFFICLFHRPFYHEHPKSMFHQGLVKPKSLMRATIWFPRMDAMVELLEETVKNCFACSAVQKDVRMQPLKMSLVPDRPW